MTNRPAASALLVAALLLTTIRLAHAAAYVGVGGGVAAPVGTFRWVDTPGLTAHGFVGAKLPLAPIEPRIDLRYTHLPHGAVGQVPEAPETDWHGIRSALFELQIDLRPRAHFDPYLLGGAGVARLAVARSFYAQPEMFDRANATVLAGGGGARWRLGALSAYVEAQYLRFRIGHADPGFERDADATPFVPVTFGLVLGGGAR